MTLENSKYFRILLKLPALLGMGTVWFLSSQSTLPHIKGVFGFDKLQHLLAYAVLAIAAGLWVPHAKRGSLPALLITAAAVSVYGVADEFHQSFVPGRDASIWDWIADTLGALIGAGTAALAFRKIKLP